MFHFTAREEAKTLRRRKIGSLFDVSSKGPVPYRYLSPFYPHGQIPVPGMENLFSESVEGIWQGLKIIGGKIDESYFRGPGKKRRGRPEGHLYGTKILGYINARKLIYVPVYTWMVYNAPLAKETALALLQEGIRGEVYLYDFDSNSNIEDTSRPLAHSSILAGILNENLQVVQRYLSDADFRQEYDKDANGGTVRYPLADQILKGDL